MGVSPCSDSPLPSQVRAWEEEPRWSLELRTGAGARLWCSGPGQTNVCCCHQPLPAGVVLWPRYTGPGGRVGTRLKQERQRFNSQLFSLASLPWKTHLPTLRAPWDQLFADPQHFFPPAPA